jgi:succinyl-diaminopimelate desuccinylase
MNPEREIVELTKDLIRFPSTHSRKEEIGRCADFIQSWLDTHQITYQRTDINDTPTITALPSEAGAPVLLMAHFDVVEAEEASLFDPREADGRLYGRGAIDDKYAVAFCMVLFKNFLENLRGSGRQQPDMPFGIALTGDEEIGGYNGAAKVVERVSTEFVLAIDGGHPDKIVTREKGVLHIELTAPGRAAHSARPWMGKNAFDVLIEDYRILKEMFSADTPDHWHDTLAMTRCRVGSGSVNQIPASATAFFDIRYTDDSNPEELIEGIRGAVASDVAVKAVEPFFNGGTSAYLDLLVANAEGAEVGFEHGASDARFLSSRGIPGAVWGADGELSQHSAAEHVVVQSIGKLYQRVHAFLEACRTPPQRDRQRQ